MPRIRETMRRTLNNRMHGPPARELDREAQSGRSDGRILISYMISRDTGEDGSNCDDRRCAHHPKHEHLHSLLSQEGKLSARIEKSLFLLQHNLPQSCETATRRYPVGCKFSSCCSKGKKRWRDGRLASLPCLAEAPRGAEGEVERSKPGGAARLSTSTTYQTSHREPSAAAVSKSSTSYKDFSSHSRCERSH